MATDQVMSSNRPYLLRAMHEWINDNGMTPYMLVDANAPGVHVPPASVKRSTEASTFGRLGRCNARMPSRALRSMPGAVDEVSAAGPIVVRGGMD